MEEAWVSVCMNKHVKREWKQTPAQGTHLVITLWCAKSESAMV